MAFEHHRQPLLSKKAFLIRVLRYGGFALGIVLGSLAVGIIGYHLTEGMGWLDALVNAAMILGGMGPVSELHSDGGKLFASLYALFSGIVFLMAVGVFLAPIVHRLYHRFHLELGMDEKNANREK